MNPKLPEIDLGLLLSELADSLTPKDVANIRELLNVNEIGLAVETFCEQLYERGAMCSRSQIDRIASIGGAIGIDPEYWEILGAGF